MKTIGPSHVYGIPAMPYPPLIGAPEGKQRFRFRSTQHARLFVRTDTGVREFAIADHGTYWQVSWEQGRNHRP